MAGFATRLHQQIQRKRTPALIGIDPRWDWLPGEIRQSATAAGGSDAEIVARGFERFSCEILELAAEHVAVVKPQVAFFEQYGVPGLQALQTVMRKARELGLLVIADAKRGDIGTTAEAYAAGWLAGEDPEAAAWPADALTINPYLGGDTLEPFASLARDRGAGLYVLVRTSNPGAAEFQDRLTDGTRMYAAVASAVVRVSEKYLGDDEDYGDVGAVVGATWPEQLQELRALMPRVPLLVPGYGSQGGTSADAAGAFAADGLGAVVNSSRGINFAWRRPGYQERFGEGKWREAVAASIQEMIADLAENTAAGELRKQL
ncbi:MAG: orotidine-5'-phosphate decarboxylase [Planctomyces sp.]